MAWRLAAIAVLCASALGADATASSDGAAGITTVVASVGGSQGELAGKDALRCVHSLCPRPCITACLTCSVCGFRQGLSLARACVHAQDHITLVKRASQHLFICHWPHMDSLGHAALRAEHAGPCPLATHGLPWPCSPASRACRALPIFAALARPSCIYCLLYA
jgi:hypothetical protein